MNLNECLKSLIFFKFFCVISLCGNGRRGMVLLTKRKLRGVFDLNLSLIFLESTMIVAEMA